MKNISEVIQHAEQRCHKNGSRLTTKRKQVLTGLIHSEKALSAYELAEFCEKNYNLSIPAMSVYRILDFLQEQLLVHKLKLANKYISCSHISCNHDHGVSQFLICSSCQSVKEIEVSQQVMADLNKSVNDAGYQLLSPQLEMNCLCHQCNNSALQ